MSGLEVGLMAVVLMLAAVYVGLHVSIALLSISFVCIWLTRGSTIAISMLSATATDAVNEYMFAVVPLFILMGLLVSISNVGRDTYDVANSLFGRLQGGLAIATVGANTLFAAVTGVSIASAAMFTRIAVPEMVRHGYSPRLAVGTVAGSSILGMLIPPSVLIIVYGILAEESIGKLFIAAIVPGLIMALAMAFMIWAIAAGYPSMAPRVASTQKLSFWQGARKLSPLGSLIFLVLGGIYGGYVTATEAGALGVLGALAIAILRRTLHRSNAWGLFRETANISASVLFLVIGATLYSRMLALTGIPAAVETWLAGGGIGAAGFLIVYLMIIILLGCLLDTLSILLIVIPVAIPIATGFGMDLAWFGIITIVAAEIGLITPPFGIALFTVKATLANQNISLRDIIIGSVPFVLCMMIVLAILAIFPSISTFLIR